MEGYASYGGKMRLARKIIYKMCKHGAIAYKCPHREERFNKDHIAYTCKSKETCKWL